MATVRLLAGVEHRIGDVGVTVESCKQQVVNATAVGGRWVQSNGQLTEIEVKLRNYNPTRNAVVRSQIGFATVTDEFGNTVKPMHVTDTFGNRLDIERQIGEGQQRDLRSDEDGEDRVVVDKTVPAAKKVIVTLDASRYGGTGKLTVELPILYKFKPEKKLDLKTIEDGVMGKTATEVTAFLGDADWASTYTPGRGDWKTDYLVYHRVYWNAQKGNHETIVVRFVTGGNNPNVVNKVTVGPP